MALEYDGRFRPRRASKGRTGWGPSFHCIHPAPFFPDRAFAGRCSVYHRPGGVEFHSHPSTGVVSRVHRVCWVCPFECCKTFDVESRPQIIRRNSLRQWGCVGSRSVIITSMRMEKNKVIAGREHKKQRKYMDALFTASRVSKLTPMFYQVTREVPTSIHAIFSSS